MKLDLHSYSDDQEALERVHSIIECLQFQKYNDEHDDLAQSIYAQCQIDEHYKWFKTFRPELIAWVDTCAIQVLMP